jgi:hypothetical protein
MEEYIKKYCCDLKESSIKEYSRTLNTIKNIVDYKNNDIFFLKDTNKITTEILSKYDKNTTIKKFFITIYSTIKKNPDFTNEEKEFYNKKMLEYRDKTNADIKENKMTQKQQDNWVSWKVIEKLPEKIKKQLKEPESDGYLNKYLIYIITLLYCKLPPVRLDYANVKVKTEDPKDKDNNYIVIKPRSVVLIMNDYKNFKKMGQIKMEYPKKIATEIRKWWNYAKTKTNGDNLIFSISDPNKPMSNELLGKTLNKIFMNYLGKDITVNTLRHIYETEVITGEEYRKYTIKQKEDIHKKLLHSFNTAQEYIKLSPFIKYFDGETNTKPEKISIKNKEKIKELLSKMNIELDD